MGRATLVAVEDENVAGEDSRDHGCFGAPKDVHINHADAHDVRTLVGGDVQTLAGGDAVTLGD